MSLRAVLAVAVILAAVVPASVVAELPYTTYACEGVFCDRVPTSLFTAIEVGKSAPGIASAAVNKTTFLFVGAAGRYTYDDWAAAVTNMTQFDMASCTKVMSTTTATAILYQRGLIDLDARVSSPELLGLGFASKGKGLITVRNLLLHNAGFPPDPNPGYSSPIFPCPENANYHPGQVFTCDDIIYNNLLYEQTLVNPPGEKYVYSDLSMITQMFVVGKVVLAHKLVPPKDFPPSCNNASSLICNFNAFVQREVFDALGMKSTQFIPTNPLLTVPEWYDPWYHHGQIVGYVSDQNAYALGGIAGHAGVFSTVIDAIQLMKLWMFDTHPKRLNSTTRDLFITVANKTQSSRALGWDTSSGPSPSCGTLSPKTFLHIGYTGTQLCGDPENGVLTVLLANGRYPDYHRDGMVAYRPIYNSLIRALLNW